jgi:hypothetical protein
LDVPEAVEKDRDADELAGSELSSSEDGGLGSELSLRRISAVPSLANPGANGFIVPPRGIMHTLKVTLV